MFWLGCFATIGVATVIAGGIGAYILFAKTSDPVPVGSPALPLVPRVTTLVDTQKEVRDDQLWSWAFSVEAGCSISVNLMADGDVKMWLVDQVEYDRLHAAHDRLFGGEFRHYPDFHLNSGRSHRAEGGLQPGAYQLVLKEASEPNLLRRADSAQAHVVLQKTCR